MDSVHKMNSYIKPNVENVLDSKKIKHVTILMISMRK